MSTETIDVLGTGMPQILVECCFKSTETIGLLGMGAQDGHLDFYTDAFS